MKQWTQTITAAAFAASLLVPTSVFSQEADPFEGHESAAWEKVQNGLLRYMPVGAASRLQFLVYHSVAETLCSDLKTDKAKTQEATSELHPENWTELSQEERAEWTNAFLVNYGIVFGVMLAEHAEHTEPFCAEARQSASDAETETYFADSAE